LFFTIYKANDMISEVCKFQKQSNMKKVYTFDDVALVPQYSDIDSRTEPDLVTWLTKTITMSMPILAANMDTVISDDLANILIEYGSVPIFHRFTTKEKKIEWLQKFGGDNIFLSTGLVDNTNDGELYELIIEHGARNICIDVAHGHSKRMMQMIESLKTVFQDLGKEFQIMAGNVCTANAYMDLVHSGADVVKVGIGPGAACTTRTVTGFGVSQFSAIQDCAEQAQKYRVPIVADGGIRGSADIVKALAAGASSVMIGKLFALTEESAAEKRGGSVIEETPNGHPVNVYYDREAKYRGQASEDFQNEFYGGLKDKTVAEGSSFWAPVTGSSRDLIEQLLGGIRSGLTYGGARNIKELQRKSEFVITTNSYSTESSVRK
jgi:IMP dehydrogenase